MTNRRPQTPLRSTRVLARLGASHPFAAHLHVLGIVDSTSDLLMEHGRQGAEDGMVVVAEGQRQGRGRRGHAWQSPPGKGLWASVLVRSLPADVTLISPAVACAVAGALDDCGATPRLKWPNDVLVAGRKVAGCLVDLAKDATGAPFAVAGVGINANLDREDLPSDPPLPAASLLQILGRPVDREGLLACVLDHLATWLDRARAGDREALRADWARRDALTGSWVVARAGDRTVEGHVIATDPLDGLTIRTAAGEEVRLRAEHTHLLSFRPD